MIVKHIDCLPVYNSPDSNVTHIVAVAIVSDYDGVCYWLAPPNRHHNLIHGLAESGFPTPIAGKQGFITNEYKFVDRIEAAEIALAAGQVLGGKLYAPPNLFSEDLWTNKTKDSVVK